MHDTHCHLDLYPDPSATCASVKHETMLVTCRPSDFERACALALPFPHIHPALGLIPQEAQLLEAQLPLFLKLLPRTRFVGEVGLDGVNQAPDVQAAQVRVLTAILQACAQAGDKILSIHSRRAATPVLDALSANFGASFPARAILHWFSGNASELRRAIGMGCFFSVNPAMVKSASGRTLMRQMPQEKVLLESDGPFVEGDLAQVVAHLSSLWQMSRETCEATLDHNWVQVKKS